MHFHKQTADFLIYERDLETLIEKIKYLGWELVIMQKPISSGTSYESHLSSNQDWFDLSIDFKFSNGDTIKLPDLLRHIKNGNRVITLADGSNGYINDIWIKKFKNFADTISSEELSADSLKLSPVKVLFHLQEFYEDEGFKSDKKAVSLFKFIDEIKSLKPKNSVSQFIGHLREYQKLGYSWLSLLVDKNIGAILADDMGLGKTIQILALFAEKLNSNQKALIVAPKSLVFNWKNELNKFTPHLKTISYVGSDRQKLLSQQKGIQVFLTTYQTLRMDIASFKDTHFDYFILDEAHAIKNIHSQSYMACKLIKAKNKIALTGTPIENSVTDLFSILSITNPGLISESLAHKYSKANHDQFEYLSKGLKPFILRRTKTQVLKDLPEKSEQILYCELSEIEKIKYNELKNYYWMNLSEKFEAKGIEKSKIEVLEALLRLRQAACHIGLVRPELGHIKSAKFDTLLDQLEIIIRENKKVLIFSQFTSLFDILKEHLDQFKINNRKVSYLYLDGKTNNREKLVNQFQTDEKIDLFLISLKAGGVGLNLTAAEYVFILDPWWNPAAESQAIDRAHRIGQTKKVFSYKIIAKDTVEEKIIKLQENKKKLAHSIISGNTELDIKNENSIFKNLKLEDLKELFL